MPPTVRVTFEAGQVSPWKLQRAVDGQWITTSRYATRNQAEKALATLVADLANPPSIPARG